MNSRTLRRYKDSFSANILVLFDVKKNEQKSKTSENNPKLLNSLKIEMKLHTVTGLKLLLKYLSDVDCNLSDQNKIENRMIKTSDVTDLKKI